MVSDPPAPPQAGTASRRGCLSWVFFLFAVAVLLAVAAGCMALIYQPLVADVTAQAR